MGAETVGSRVRRYRRLKKLTQDRLAELADVDRRYLGRIETEDVLEPGADTVRKLAGALGVSIRALAEPLGWFEEEAVAPSIQDAVAQHPGWDDETKQALLKIIELADAQLAEGTDPRVPGRKR